MHRMLLGVGTVLSLSAFICDTQATKPVAAKKTVLDSATKADFQVTIPASDLETSKKFYEALGCKTVSTNGLAVTMSGGGLSLHLVAAKDFRPSNYPLFAWSFANLNDVADGLIELKWKCEDSRSLPDGLAYFTSFGPGSGLLLKDPSGNIVSFICPMK